MKKGLSFKWITAGIIGSYSVLGVTVLFLIKGPVVSIGGSFDWGSLIGGVIGGFLTLIGVRLTLMKQANEKFIEVYPQKMKIIGEIISKMNVVVENSYRLTQGFQGQYLGHCQAIVDLAAQVDGIVYEKVIGLSDLFKSYIDKLYGNGESDILFMNSSRVPEVKDGKVDEFNKHKQELNDKIAKISDDLRSYQDKLREKFFELS